MEDVNAKHTLMTRVSNIYNACRSIENLIREAGFPEKDDVDEMVQSAQMAGQSIVEISERIERIAFEKEMQHAINVLRDGVEDHRDRHNLGERTRGKTLETHSCIQVGTTIVAMKFS